MHHSLIQSWWQSNFSSSGDGLVANDINITKDLRAFHENSIDEPKQGEDLNCLRVMSLSHVSPLNKSDRKKCITRCLKKDTQKALQLLGRQTKPALLDTSAKAVLYCHKKMIEAEEEEEQKEMLRMIKDLVRQRALSKGRILPTSEASFTDKYVLPSIKRVLLEKLDDEHCYAMFDKSIDNGKKPDFLLGATAQNNKDVFFFFVEVKRPDTPCEYQAESDYTKLMKLMKTSVDAQLSLGVKFPLSLDLLVEGFECTLFQMMQAADGIYLPSAIKCFSLVCEDHQLVYLPSVVEPLYYVKLEFEKFVAEVNTKRTRKERDVERVRVCHSFDTKTEAEKKKRARKGQ